MPDNLKAGVESLSGIDMSDVKVHYNSINLLRLGHWRILREKIFM